VNELEGLPAAGLDREFRQRILALHRIEALELLAAAMDAWRNTGYTRYDDREVSCTVRVFAELLTILDEQARLEGIQIFPEIESVQPTRAQLEGRANFSRARRPDLVLYLGGNRSHRMIVECKRLLGSANASRYVGDGLMRFVNGDYPADDGRAVMIAYVMTKEIAIRVTEINAAIDAHDDLGPAHRLDGPTAQPPIDDVYNSEHGDARQLVVTHMFLDMRDRIPSHRSELRTRSAAEVLDPASLGRG
jgi:hypothetical protein